MKPLSSPWDSQIDAWCLTLRAAGRPPTTVRLRAKHVQQLARWAGRPDPWGLQLADLIEYAAAHAWSLEMRRSVRSSLRMFYAWAVDTGHLEASPAAGLPAVPARPPRPRPASESAYLRALDAAPPRERTMLRLAAEAGLRRGEVARVHSRDLYADLLGWSLRVRGKGDRVRIVPLTDSLADELRARPSGWAFPGADHGHLSAQWVGKIIGELLPDGITMHSLRHRFATRAYATSADLLAVQQLLGHSSPATTRAYVRVDEPRTRAIVESVGRAA